MSCREHMTDVVVQDLTTQEQLRINCKDYVKKLAVYKARLAIQLPQQIVVYELQSGADISAMQYKPVAVIQQALECNLLVVTALHLILCQVSVQLNCVSHLNSLSEFRLAGSDRMRHVHVHLCLAVSP